MNPKMVPLIWGLVVGGIGVWSIFGMSSGFKYVIGPLCLFFGWVSIKAAVVITEREITEITQHGKPISKEIEDKIKKM
jgi:hypothetical protein